MILSPVPENVVEAAQAHALQSYPQESCGLVVGGEYLPCENVADLPEEDFSIRDQIVMPYIVAGTLQAVIHSHPVKAIFAPSDPSVRDMIGQISAQVPWGIIDTDGEVVTAPYWFGDITLDTPLLGVEFHHGVQDCYTAIRKWYWQTRGIKLKDFPRQGMWWCEDENLYVDNFAKAGFFIVDICDIQDGDVVLGKIKSEVINHAGIYLDNSVDGCGLVYHHLPGRLSRRESAGPWLNRTELVVRYNAD